MSGCPLDEGTVGTTHFILASNQFHVKSFLVSQNGQNVRELTDPGRNENEKKEVDGILTDEAENRSNNDKTSKSKSSNRIQRFRNQGKRQIFKQQRPNFRLNNNVKQTRTIELQKLTLVLEVAVLIDGSMLADFMEIYSDEQVAIQQLSSYVIKLCNFAAMRFRLPSLTTKIQLSLVGLWIYRINSPRDPTSSVPDSKFNTYVWALRDLEEYVAKKKAQNQNFRPDVTLLLTGMSDRIRAGRSYIGKACARKSISIVQTKFRCPAGQDKVECLRGEHTDKLKKVLTDPTSFEFTVFLNSATIAHELGHTIGMRDLYTLNTCKPNGIMGFGHSYWNACSVKDLTTWLSASQQNIECITRQLSKQRGVNKAIDKTNSEANRGNLDLLSSERA